MRDSSAREVADAVEESDFLELEVEPCPEAVLSAAALAESVSAVDTGFRFSFVDPFTRSDGLRVSAGDHSRVYGVTRELGVDVPELSLAASVCTVGGPDSDILEEGLARGGLSVDEGLVLSGELGEALETCVDPLVEELAGDSMEAGSALRDLGVGLGSRAEDLEDYQVARLSSYLVARLVEQGASPASIRLLLMGRVEGRYGDVLDLASIAEALVHSEGASAALSAVLAGDDVETEDFRLEVAEAVGVCSREGLRVCEVEKGPALKVAKVLARDLRPGEPVLVDSGDLVYGAGLEPESAAWTGGGWFAAESLEEAERTLEVA